MGSCAQRAHHIALTVMFSASASASANAPGSPMELLRKLYTTHKAQLDEHTALTSLRVCLCFE
jgi:hypothetical protein